VPTGKYCRVLVVILGLYRSCVPAGYRPIVHACADSYPLSCHEAYSSQAAASTRGPGSREILWLSVQVHRTHSFGMIGRHHCVG